MGYVNKLINKFVDKINETDRVSRDEVINLENSIGENIISSNMNLLELTTESTTSNAKLVMEIMNVVKEETKTKPMTSPEAVAIFLDLKRELSLFFFNISDLHQFASARQALTSIDRDKCLTLVGDEVVNPMNITSDDRDLFVSELFNLLDMKFDLNTLESKPIYPSVIDVIKAMYVETTIESVCDYINSSSDRYSVENIVAMLVNIDKIKDIVYTWLDKLDKLISSCQLLGNDIYPNENIRTAALKYLQLTNIFKNDVFIKEILTEYHVTK